MRYILLLFILINFYNCKCDFNTKDILNKYKLISIETGKGSIDGKFFLGIGYVKGGDLFYYLLLETKKGIKPLVIKQGMFKVVYIHFIEKNIIPYVTCNSYLKYFNDNHMGYPSHLELHLYLPKNSIKNIYNISLSKDN